jgi:hypothetical protein
MAGNASKENGKLGGRSKGSLNPETVKRNHIRKMMLDRIEKEFTPLMDSAVDLAKAALSINIVTVLAPIAVPSSPRDGFNEFGALIVKKLLEFILQLF